MTSIGRIKSTLERRFARDGLRGLSLYILEAMARRGRILMSLRHYKVSSKQDKLLRKGYAENTLSQKKLLEKERAKNREQKTRIKHLLAELRKARAYRYGSYTEGRKDWEERWDRMRGRRVLFYALSDYSGSFYKWAEAINRYTDYAVRLAVLQHHQFGYRNDLVMAYPDVVDRSDLRGLAREADIIHIKDESGFFTGSNRLPKDLFAALGKPQIFTAYGGYMRKFADDPHFQRAVGRFDARVAMTPDLVYDWFDAYFVPHGIDTEAQAYRWNDSPRLCHSPSTKARKGTDDLVAAIDGLDIDFDLIHGVDHDECMRRKCEAGLFFDQAGTEIKDRLGVDTVIGWYGNSALEAAVFGIPTIAHLSKRAFEGARRAGRDIERRCAIINTARGPEAIRQTIEAYYAMSPDARRMLSLKTREWIEDFHSYQACASELVGIYDGLLGVQREVAGIDARMGQKAFASGMNISTD